MSVSTILREFLVGHHVPFEHHVHPTAYTGQEIASSMHLSGRDIAKTVVIEADGALLLAVVPADQRVDLVHLRFVTRAANIRIAGRKGICGSIPNLRTGGRATVRKPVRSGHLLRHVTGAGRLHRVQCREPYRHYSDGVRRLQATGKTDDDRPGRTSPSARRLSRQVVLEAADYTCNPRSFSVHFTWPAYM